MTLNHLIELSEKYALSQETQSELPGIAVLRRDRPSGIEASIYRPVICLILRGAKVTSIGEQAASVRAGDALLVSHDLPVVSRITEASRETPYLALILALDLGLLRGLYETVGENLLPEEKARSISVGRADPIWSEPLERYLALLDKPLDQKVLGPALLREIHYRLLQSPMGGMMRNLLAVDSHASRIGRAIIQIGRNYRSPLAVTDLARTAGMSASSFHDHFRAITGTTPLQYVKDLRLIEAQRLLNAEGRSVADAAFAVGYESPTHFSRDYSRKFNRPPSHEGDTRTLAAGAAA